jgi:hypothetical protein
MEAVQRISNPLTSDGLGKILPLGVQEAYGI